MWQEIGMWCLVLTALFIFSRVWFYLVEGLLAGIKSLLNGHKKPPVWHTFEETDQEKKQ